MTPQWPTESHTTTLDRVITALVIVVFLLVLIIVALWSNDLLAADAATTQCPNVGEPCKILVLTPGEEQLLIKQNGILDSASAGRYIDLGNVAAYFRMKLMQAPEGEIKLPASPAPAQDKKTD